MRAVVDSVVLPSLILNCGPTSTPTPYTRDPARRNAPAPHIEHTPDHDTDHVTRDQAQDAVGGWEGKLEPRKRQKHTQSYGFDGSRRQPQSSAKTNAENKLDAVPIKEGRC